MLQFDAAQKGEIHSQWSEVASAPEGCLPCPVAFGRAAWRFILGRRRTVYYMVLYSTRLYMLSISYSRAGVWCRGGETES